MNGIARHMPATAPRLSRLEQVHVITTTTLKRTALFKDFQLGRLLVRELREAQEQHLADSLAWVVMPDQLHWLVALQGDSLDRLVQRIKSRSSAAVNRELGTEGLIWQTGYEDRPVREEGDLLLLARQIIANPGQAGLVEHPGDYPLWDAIWV